MTDVPLNAYYNQRRLLYFFTIFKMLDIFEGVRQNDTNNVYQQTASKSQPGHDQQFYHSIQIKPYVGAGFGYFWFIDSWEYEYYETYEDPLFTGVFHTYIETGNGSDTLAHGLFPFVTGGLTVPITSNLELQFEVQYHYDKQDSGSDFEGPVYMFGCLFRF